MLWDKGVGEFVQASQPPSSDGQIARFVLVGAPDRENPASIPPSFVKEWHGTGVVEWWGHRNPSALVSAIRTLLDDPNLRVSMGIRGREIVMKEFSEEKVVRRTIALYRAMLDER